MGRVEKVIVLSVLFLVTLILVISLNTSETPDGFSSDPRIDQLMSGGGPNSEADRGLAEGGSTPAGPVGPAATPQGGRPVDDPRADHLAVQDPRAGESALPDELDLGPRRGARGGSGQSEPDHLLSSTVARDGQAPVPPPAADVPSGSILITSRGLEESYLPEYRFYTLRPGDDFGTLAKRFYGDRRRVGLLRSVNEGAQSFVTGDTILVPVFAPEVPPAHADAGAEATPYSASDVYHVVRDGDSLWKIAKEHYGAGTRWREVFDANRDVMSGEDSLNPGMRLRIP